MKKLLFVIFLIIPSIVNASDFNINCPNIYINKEFECIITSNSNNIINNYSFNLELDNVTCLSPESVCKSLKSNALNLSINKGEIIEKIKFITTKKGTISLKSCTYNSTVNCDNVLNVTPISQLKGIKINNKEVNLDKSIYEYNISSESANKEFKISGIGEEIKLESKTKIENGIINIDYGQTESIKVTGLDNISYIINLTNTYNYLEIKSVKVNNKEITKTAGGKYKIEVANNITSANIEVVPSNEKNKVVGNGLYDLKEGENICPVVIMDDQGNKKEYKIIVTRKENLNLNSNNNLKTLTINGVNIKKIQKEIVIGVSNNEEKLNITAKFSSNIGNVEYDDIKLEIGINETNFRVYGEDGLFQEYKLIIIKEPPKVITPNEKNKIIKNLENDNVIVKLNQKDEKIVSREILNSINNHKLIYEIMGDNNVILYTIEFKGEQFKTYNKDINIDIKFNTKKQILKKDSYFNIRFLNDQVLPCDVSVNIYIDKQNYQNLYKYNGSKKLELIKSDIKNNNYYATFKIKHLSEYILTTEKIIYSCKTKIIALIITIVILVGISIILLFKKKIFKKIYQYIIRQKNKK